MIHERYDTVVLHVNVSGTPFRLLAVRDTNELVDTIDPAVFAEDERFPYWADLWVSSVVLAEHLPALVKGKRVLELGCGLGLAGIAAARADATVTLTDIDPDALRFAAENAALNLEPDQRERVNLLAVNRRFIPITATALLAVVAYGIGAWNFEGMRNPQVFLNMFRNSSYYLISAIGSKKPFSSSENDKIDNMGNQNRWFALHRLKV